MTTFEQTETLAGTRVAEAAPHEPRRRGDLWWRYLVSLLAIAFALFPAVYVVSAAFNPVPSLSTASIVPEGITLENFRKILSDPREPYPNWYLNTMLIATVTAVVTVLLGARSAGELMAVPAFRALGVSLRIATDDGSEGQRGLVTELLGAELAAGPARVYACGPTPMMRRAAELAAAAAQPCLASLENRMACGFGVCLGCAVPRAGGGYALVCRDGPVFAADGLRWEGLP